VAAPIVYILGQAGIAAVRWAAPYAVRALPYAGRAATAAIELGKSSFRAVLGRSSSAAATSAVSTASVGATAAGGAASVLSRTGEVLRNGTRVAASVTGRSAQVAAAGAVGAMSSTATGVVQTAAMTAGIVYALNEARKYISNAFFGPEEMRARLGAIGPQSAVAQELEARTSDQQQSRIDRTGVGTVFDLNRGDHRLIVPVPGSEDISSPADRLRHAEEWWTKERASGRITQDLGPGDRLNFLNGDSREVYSRGDDGRFAFDRGAMRPNVQQGGGRLRAISGVAALDVFSDADAGRSLLGNAASIEPERLDTSRAAVFDVGGTRGVGVAIPGSQHSSVFVATRNGETMIVRGDAVAPKEVGGAGLVRYSAVDLGESGRLGADGRLVLTDEAQRRAASLGNMETSRNPVEDLLLAQRGGKSSTMSRIDPSDPSKATFEAVYDGGRSDGRFRVMAQNGEMSLSRVRANGEAYGEAQTIRDGSISLDGKGNLSMSAGVRRTLEGGVDNLGLSGSAAQARGSFSTLQPDRAVTELGGRAMDTGMSR